MMPAQRTAWLIVGMALLLTGCRSADSVSASDIAALGTPIPTPSVIPQADTVGFRPSFGASVDGPKPGAGSSPTPVAAATPTTSPAREAPEYVEATVFQDELERDWRLDQSEGVTYDPFDSSHWFSEMDPRIELDSGAVTVAVTPLQEFGTLRFSVRDGARTAYPRDKVLGISMWINSGSDILDTDDLSVTVIGSNDLPYWSPNDYSVFSDVDGSFSETRLYYLGLNRAIPPDTWAHIVVWLDDLQFDPPYEYVTGFYIKNDADLSRTYYVDNVSLLMLP